MDDRRASISLASEPATRNRKDVALDRPKRRQGILRELLLGESKAASMKSVARLGMSLTAWSADHSITGAPEGPGLTYVHPGRLGQRSRMIEHADESRPEYRR